MLTRLRRALASWTPATGDTRARPASEVHALGAILSVWPEVVGEAVARHASPVEYTGNTLLVRVSSSAWGNQLSLSSTQIIRALAAAGIEGIERLRFRTGPARKRRTPPPERAPSNVPSPQFPPQEEPASTLGEAILRLRRRLVQLRDAKDALGWKPCPQCAAMVPEGGYCAACATAVAAARAARVQRLMYEAPWLGFAETAALVDGLTHEEYDGNRKALLGRWWETLRRAARLGQTDATGYERRVASSYVLLKTGWTPERITPALVRNELGDEIHNLLWPPTSNGEIAK